MRTLKFNEEATHEANRMVIDAMLGQLRSGELTLEQREELVYNVNKILDMDTHSRRSDYKFMRIKGMLKGQLLTIICGTGGCILGLIIKQLRK